MMVDLTEPAVAIGFLGTIAGMLWPLAPSRVGMLVAQGIAGALFTVHYALIGAWTGGALNALATLQVVAAIPLGTRSGFRRVYLLTIPVLALLMAVTWHGWPSAFAAAAMALMSLGRYQLDEARFRACFLAALPCWFGHNFLVGSVPGMVSDTMGMANNSLMFAHLLWRRRKAQQTADAAG